MEIVHYPNPEQSVRDLANGWIAAEWSRDCERVELPNGFRAPREWMFFDNTGPKSAPMFVVECKIGDDLVPRVVTVMACSRTGDREVQASDLRRLRPLQDILEDSLQLVAFRPGPARISTRPRDLLAEAAEEANDATDLRRTLRGVRRQDRRRFTDDMAGQVAAVYVENVDSGMPTKAVREHFGIAPSTASLYVKRARTEIDRLLKERADGER